MLTQDGLMPGMDGFSFLEALRREPAWRSIPIVVVTAEDPERLNGYVQNIVDEGTPGREEVLQELGERIGARVGKIA